MKRVALLALVACGGDPAPPPRHEPYGIVVGSTSLADARARVEATGARCVPAPFPHRLSCPRPGGSPRVLLVAERPDAPVTSVAIQRTHRDRGAALADATDLFAELARRLGAAAPPCPVVALRPATPVECTWRVRGGTVRAVAVDLGATGVSVSETTTAR